MEQTAVTDHEQHTDLTVRRHSVGRNITRSHA